MRFLITGAQGFVGRYLTGAILSNCPDAEVLGLGRSSRCDGYFSHTVTIAGKAVQAHVPEFLRTLPADRYAYEQFSIEDTDGLRGMAERFRPDAVIHLASGLRGDEWQSLVRTNVEGTASLLTALGQSAHPPSVVVLGSTGGVYGVIAPEDLPVTEDSYCMPADMYSATKLSAEQIGRVLCAEYGMRYVAARLFNIAGPGQSERHVCGRFASAIAGIAGAPEPVLRAGDLTATRDYVDVRDAASALLLLAQSGEGIYNVASGVETSTGDVLDILARLAGVSETLRIEPSGAVAVGVPRHAGSVRRLESLGFPSEYTLERSLRDILDYYMAATAERAYSSHPSLCTT